MKKAILLLGFFLIAITLLWRVQTNRLKKFVTQVVECDAISSRGFPFIAEIKLKNPRLTHENLKISHEGTILLGSPIFMNQGWLYSNGTTSLNQKTLLSGEFSVKKYNLKRLFRLFQEPAIGNLDAVQKGMLLSSFLGNFSFSANNLKATHRGELVFEMGSGSVEWEKTSKDPSQASLTINLNDYAIGSEFSDMIPKTLSQSALKAKITSRFPCDLSDMNEMLPWTFEIEKLTTSDPYLEGEGSYKLTIDQKKGDLIAGAFACNSSVKYNKQYPLPDQKKFLLKAGLFLMNYPTIEKMVKKYWTELQSLLPDLPSFGIIKSEVAIRFQGNEQAWANNSLIQIDQLKIGSNSYGLNFQGEIKNGSKSMAALRLTVTNHRDSLHDLTNYYRRWHKLLSRPDLLGEALPPINEKMESKVAHFLESLAETRSDKELTLSFKYDSPTYTIGSYTPAQFDQAIQKLSAELIAELPKKAPPAKAELPAKTEAPVKAELPAKTKPPVKADPALKAEN